MSYQYYLNHISAYEREFKPWEVRARKVVERYRAEEEFAGKGARFNVLWSNVQTLKAATFARMPMPDVSRRFKDNDPVGRVAALLLERALDFQVQHFKDYGASVRQCVYDRFLGGRGTAWVRYEPTIKKVAKESEEGEQITEDQENKLDEELTDENAPVDYVHWKDFGHSIARTWEELNIIWRKVYMTQAMLDERFPDKKIPLDTMPDEEKTKGSADSDSVNKRALIYEIWDKEKGKAFWLSKSLGKIVDEKDDPLGLEEFFPCPPPIYSTLTTDSLVPIPDYVLYQDQAKELDLLSDRIDGLIQALRIRGVYDASEHDLARLFKEGEHGDLIPVKNWQAFVEKNGLQGSINLVETLPIAQTLAEAYKAFEQVKSQIYELTGISDILRGETAASETATAQTIKNSYASLRLKVYQDEVERFATRLLQLKAQIICNHFDAKTICEMACCEQMSPEDQKLVYVADADGKIIPGPDGKPIPDGPAVKMLKGRMMRSFRIEVESDSMAFQDEQQDKQDGMEFLNATGNFLKLMQEVASISPQMVPMGIELMKFGVTRFRVGKNIEGTLDQAIDGLKQQAAQQAQQPKPPAPEQIKAQAAAQIAQGKAQADMQQTQMVEQGKLQAVQLKEQAQTQRQAQEQAQERFLAQLQARSDERESANQARHEAQLAAMERAHAGAVEQFKSQLQLVLQRMKDATTLEVAEMSAQTTLDAAQISAAKAGDEP